MSAPDACAILDGGDGRFSTELDVDRAVARLASHRALESGLHLKRVPLPAVLPAEEPDNELLRVRPEHLRAGLDPCADLAAPEVARGDEDALIAADSLHFPCVRVGPDEQAHTIVAHHPHRCRCGGPVPAEGGEADVTLPREVAEHDRTP